MSRHMRAADLCDVASGASGSRRSGIPLVMASVATLAPLLGALAPRGLAPLLVAASVVGAVMFRVRMGCWPTPPVHWLAVVSGLILFAATTIAWTPAPGEAVDQVVQFLYLLLPPLFLLAAVSEVDDAAPRAIRWLVSAFILALAVLAIEVTLGMPLRTLASGRSEVSSDLTELNRSLTVAVALVWPAMLAALRLGGRRTAWPLAAGLMAAGLIVPVALGESQSAQFGLAVGLVVLPCAVVAPRLVRRGLGAATVIVFAGIVPICLWLPEAGPEWLPLSAQHRLEIWQFSAERVLDHPLFGSGLDASRQLGAGHVSRTLVGEMNLLPLHPHDAYLQIWLELGLVGAAIALAACLLLIRAVGRLDESAQPLALAAYASASAMAAVSYGIWQSWWLSTLVLAALLTAVAARGGKDQSRP